MYVRAIDTGVGLGFERWFGLLWVYNKRLGKKWLWGWFDTFLTSSRAKLTFKLKSCFRYQGVERSENGLYVFIRCLAM